MRERNVQTSELRYDGQMIQAIEVRPRKEAVGALSCREYRYLPQPALGGESWWRRGESNPRPKSLTLERLHAYPVHFKLSPTALRNEQERTAS